MPHSYLYRQSDGSLLRVARASDVERFDPWSLQWTPEDRQPGAEGDCRPMASATESVTLLHRHARVARSPVRRLPVGVIGPKEATPAQCATAEELGAKLADAGFQMLCGGRNGVMEAACKGHFAAGGMPIGILPGDEWSEANPFVAIPLASGMGPARNAVIARACFALIAVGGGYGTLSEMAFGLHFNRAVFSLEGAPAVAGAIECHDAADALERTATRFLELPAG